MSRNSEYLKHIASVVAMYIHPNYASDLEKIADLLTATEQERDIYKRNLELLEGICKVHDEALKINSKILIALKPLIPPNDSLTQKGKMQWQEVVNAIFEAAEFADKNSSILSRYERENNETP